MQHRFQSILKAPAPSRGMPRWLSLMGWPWLLVVLCLSSMLAAQPRDRGAGRDARAQPVDALEGTLAPRWRPAGHQSISPRSFGIETVPVAHYDVLTTPDDRMLLAYAQGTVAAGRYTNAVVVKQFDRGRWMEVGRPIVLEQGPARGDMLHTWAGQRYPDTFRHPVGIVLSPARDTVQVVVVLPLPRGPELRIATLDGSTWRTHSVELPHSMAGRKPDAPLPGVVCDPAGGVYTWLIDYSDDPAGQLRVYEREGDDWRAMKWSQAVEGAIVAAKLHVRGRTPMLAVHTQQQDLRTIRCYTWIDGKWQQLLADEAEAVSTMGMPVGQRDDGMPVWVAQSLVGDAATTHSRFVEPGADGKLKSFDLPGFDRGNGLTSVVDSRLSQVRVRWTAQGEPIVAASGLLVRTTDPARAARMNRLAVAAWVRADGQFDTLCMTGRAAFMRQPMGDGDVFLDADVVVSAEGGALLLWQSPLPMHGPTALYAAHLPRVPVRQR